MTKKIYLMWNSYISNELLTICVLTKVKQLYLFKYDKEALKAQEQGCMLPFPYSEKVSCFSKLPSFFESRKLNPDTRKRMGIVCDDDDFSILLSNHGQKNSDNFLIISDKTYQMLKNPEEDKTLKR